MNKKDIPILAFLFLLTSIFCYSQSNNSILVYHIQEKVDSWREKLDLSTKERYQLVSILTDHRIKQSNLDIFSDTLDKQYNRLIVERNNNIEKLLGKNRLQSFLLFQEIEINGILESVNEIETIANLNEEVTSRIVSYKLKYILPQLSKISEEFRQKLSSHDIINLRTIQELFYNQLGSEVSIIGLELDTELKKKFYRYLEQIKEFVNNNHQSLHAIREVWNKDQNKIYTNYLNENNLNSLKKGKELLSEFRVNEKLFYLHLLLLKPYDRDAYFYNLQICLNFEKNLKELILKRN